MNEKIHGLIGQALELLQSGKPAEAEKALVKILNLDSNNLPARKFLGLSKVPMESMRSLQNIWLKP